MNQYHIDRVMMGIESFLKGKKSRVLQSFTATGSQLDLAGRIQKVRKRLKMIPAGATVMVYGANMDAVYLFRFTELYKKNVIGLIEERDVTDFYDNYHGMRRYQVFLPQKEIIDQADCIVIADFEWKEKIKKRLKDFKYAGKVVSIYDQKDALPFYCVFGQQHEKRGSSLYAQANFGSYYIPGEFYLSIMDRIDKINHKLESCKGKKTIIYGAGYHSVFLLEYTDMKQYEVIAISDKNVKDFYGVEVREAVKESFEDCDCIVVSSYKFQQDMANMLRVLGQGEKLVLLYDSEDKAEFYENFNTFSPDSEIPAIKYELQDVLMQAEETMNTLTRSSDFYLTYQILPDAMRLPALEYEDDAEVNKRKDYVTANEKIAIIVQGPVIYDDDFTFHTLCRYQRMFRGAAIILSTWDDEMGKDEFQKFKDLGIELAFSKPPKDGGILNVNYQVQSSHAGVRRAQELGIPYCIKTRTDFRIYAKGCLKLIDTLLQKYPLSERGRQHERLVVLPPYLDVGYYIPDYIVAGNTEDMLHFWVEPKANISGKVMNPEMMLFSSYLQSIGRYEENPVEHLENYMGLLAERFIVVDPDMFQAVWKKYTYQKFERADISGNRFTFVDWLAKQ